MKYILISALTLFIHYNLQAQVFSCGGASRYDAAFSKAIQQLEYASISLKQVKTVKVTTEKNPGSASSYYAVQGAASPVQFTSLEANIGFNYCTKTPVLELYKTQVQNGMRTFTIPAGSNGNTAVNIPIQVLYPPGWSPERKGQSFIKIKFTNGYLSAGEYVLIDKTSLTTDGTQMKGIAFSIK
ncbi:MAG: hypothetical protein Q8941_16765 [Bacteroidota bacterium]|nr:hypothetical protein [Bacteroidota bacterium]